MDTQTEWSGPSGAWVENELRARIEQIKAERDALKERLAAVEALPERWRKTHPEWHDKYIKATLDCAAELEATLKVKSDEE